MEQNVLEFPAVLMVAKHPNFGVSFEFEIQHRALRIQAHTVIQKIRQACKDFLPELYFLKIKLDDPKAKGRDTKGKAIPIDNLGRWVFGVPGFPAHYAQDLSNPTKVIVWVPKDSPPQVKEMFTLLKETQILSS